MAKHPGGAPMSDAQREAKLYVARVTSSGPRPSDFLFPKDTTPEALGAAIVETFDFAFLEALFSYLYREGRKKHLPQRKLTRASRISLAQLPK